PHLSTIPPVLTSSVAPLAPRRARPRHRAHPPSGMAAATARRDLRPPARRRAPGRGGGARPAPTAGSRVPPLHHTRAGGGDTPRGSAHPAPRPRGGARSGRGAPPLARPLPSGARLGGGPGHGARVLSIGPAAA